MKDSKKRINMLERNLQQSLDKYNNGEITYDYYKLLKADVDKAIKRIKSEGK